MKCCGLTAFSNLLRRFDDVYDTDARCGLTAFSNLLQPMSI